MTKRNKSLNRLFSKPKDFRWAELCTLLKRLGYEQIQGDGSRVKFFHREKDSLIILHSPHPEKVIKSYAIKDVIENLKGAGFKP